MARARASGVANGSEQEAKYSDFKDPGTPPKTFDEMLTMAQQLKAQGKPYEIGFAS